MCAWEVNSETGASENTAAWAHKAMPCSAVAGRLYTYMAVTAMAVSHLQC